MLGLNRSDQWDRNLFPSGFHDLECIFVHVPKAAGSSVSQSLWGYQVGHRSIADYFKANPEAAKDYFKFSVVRNPWDRLVSSYHYLVAGGNNKADLEWARKYLQVFSTFEEFVINGLSDPEIARWIHFRPQYMFVCNAKRVVQVDYLARYESLSEDFKYIQSRLNKSVELPRSNTSARTDYRSYFTDTMIERVAEHYSRDIGIFGYTFG